MKSTRTVAAAAAGVLALGGLVPPATHAVEESDVPPDRTIVGVSRGALQRGMDVDDDGNVYVVSDDRAIRVYAAGASGRAAPVRTISGPRTQLTDSANVAVGPDGRVYVASYTEPAKVLVFAPGADGDAAPERVVTGPRTRLEDVKSLTVGPDGSVYVVCDDEGFDGRVLVLAPGADGDVAPSRVIQGSRTLLISPEDAAVAEDGTLFVTEWNPGYVNAFRKGAKGDVAPFRTIRLSRPELWQSTRLDVDSHGYVYVGGYSGDRVFVFHRTSEGDAEPVTVLSGKRSGIRRPWNVALDGSRNLYVGNYDTDDVTVHALLERPSAVRDVTVHGRAKAEERRITWRPPRRDGGRDVTAYVVRVRSGGKKLLTKRVAGTSTRVDRRHLRSGDHVVSVTARNAVGEGPRGTARFRVAAIRPAPVRRIRVGGGPGARVRVVRWRRPAWDGGAKVTRYRVVVKAGRRVVLRTSVKKRRLVLDAAAVGTGRRVVVVRAGSAKGLGPGARRTFRVA